jgi:hypothetical protein
MCGTNRLDVGSQRAGLSRPRGISRGARMRG